MSREREFWVQGRAPLGARGLKQDPLTSITSGVKSRPARGAWIETPPAAPSTTLPSSRPARGAWIETVLLDREVGHIGRAPLGARGLKQQRHHYPQRWIGVAPRSGRVD